MTSTGTFIRRAVRKKASFHWAAVKRSASPERRAATKTPVPAAESQLITKRAPSGFAPALATGGMRCTWLFRAGMSHPGRESVPVNGEPRSVVLTFTSEKTLFSVVFHLGIPQMPQQRIRIIQGSQAYAVWPAVYLYFHTSAGAAPTVAAFVFAASRSDFNRKRVFGCQTKRRKRAVRMTEKTPETTSVIRWVGAQPEANHCITAKDPPETSAPGQTSKASFQVPPSIFTKVATSQKGTRIDTNGSWWPAILESVSSSRPLTAASVTIGVPIGPHATGAVFARRFRTADWKGLNPRPTMTAPAIATGVPKPEVPSMIAPKENAMRRTWSRRSNEMWMIDSFTISNWPVTTVIVYRNMAASTIQMIPRKPEKEPSAKAEMADGSGIPNATHETRKAARTP